MSAKIIVTYDPQTGVHVNSEPDNMGFDTALFVLELAKQALIVTTFDQIRQAAEQGEDENYNDVDKDTQYQIDEFTPEDEPILDEDFSEGRVVDEDDLA